MKVEKPAAADTRAARSANLIMVIVEYIVSVRPVMVICLAIRRCVKKLR